VLLTLCARDQADGFVRDSKSEAQLVTAFYCRPSIGTSKKTQIQLISGIESATASLCDISLTLHVSFSSLIWAAPSKTDHGVLILVRWPWREVKHGGGRRFCQATAGEEQTSPAIGVKYLTGLRLHFWFVAHLVLVRGKMSADRRREEPGLLGGWIE
jgi:hypothetical protein